ncbi:MAG: hypothetical protein WC760_08000 [Bacteroidia bacterium]|jgi:hypothetical protein
MLFVFSLNKINLIFIRFKTNPGFEITEEKMPDFYVVHSGRRLRDRPKGKLAHPLWGKPGAQRGLATKSPTMKVSAQD